MELLPRCYVVDTAEQKIDAVPRFTSSASHNLTSQLVPSWLGTKGLVHLSHLQSNVTRSHLSMVPHCSSPWEDKRILNQVKRPVRWMMQMLHSRPRQCHRCNLDKGTAF